VAALAVSLDETGSAAVSFALPPEPGLLGLSLLAPWLVVAPGGCAAAGWSFSNALEVVIG
jgi:hypothetical protein